MNECLDCFEGITFQSVVNVNVAFSAHLKRYSFDNDGRGCFSRTFIGGFDLCVWLEGFDSLLIGASWGEEKTGRNKIGIRAAFWHGQLLCNQRHARPRVKDVGYAVFRKAYEIFSGEPL